ncbi:hypothetical protein ABXS75_03070 [Roseburia hominis]
MVELFEQDIRKNDRQSSKGNQLKWKNEGVWYKADYTGYEGLAEYMVSHLLGYSTLEKEEYVLYDLEQIKYKSIVYNGVKSKDFLYGDWQIITLERLFKNIFNVSLYQSVFRIGNHEERLHFLVNQVERITHLKDFGKYLTKLFTIDAFFLNEDRHMHNIAVLMNAEGEFAYCPIFDHGAGLLSDTTMDYPVGGNLEEFMREVSAKTISGDFEEQLDLAKAMFGGQMKFSFRKKEVEELLNAAEGYSVAEKERVKEILYLQMRKYQYLF